MEPMETGQYITIDLISSCDSYEGILTSSRPISTTGFQGVECEIDIPGYGPVDVLFQGGAFSEARLNDVRARAGIPQRFAGIKWNDFRWSYYGSQEATKRPFEISRSYILKNDYYRENGKGLYILGRTSGSGKTMLACVLANEIMNKYSCSVKYIDQEQYLTLLRSDEAGARNYIKAIWNCPVLFLDGFGNCGTQWQREQMLKLIETRQRSGYSTCYISSTPPMKVMFDDSCKANDLINANALQVRIPDVQVRAMIAAESNKQFERNLFKDPCQLELNFSGA